MRRFTALLAAAIALGGLTASPASAAARTWYVQAGSTHTAGTKTQPFGSLAQAQSASLAGDTIVVLPSALVLDGGIELKPGQTLRGVGALSGALPGPKLTNTTANLDGDAVRLADRTTVSHLRIAGSKRGAIYGLNVSGVRVTDNDITGHNTSCTEGFHIPGFNIPTNVPGVGAPIPGLTNGWAGIMVDATTGTGRTVQIDHNDVHDATCGDGIDVRFSGDASGTATIADNRIHKLGQGRTFMSLLAIGLQTADSASLVGQIHRNTQTELGNALDLNLVQGADSEGVFLQSSGPSRMDATVTHNTYANADGHGGFSANGLEMASMGAGSRMTATIRDSTFTAPSGDVIENAALGTDAVMNMTLERVTAEKSGGVGNTFLIPANNGDCVVAGSLGARNVVGLTVRDSILRDCSNNGLSMGSNVVNGSGPTTAVRLDVDNTTITGNRGGNLGIRNFTALDALEVKVQRSNLQGTTGLGSSIAAVAAEDLGSTTSASIDLGGGPLGGAGQNCIGGGLLTAVHVLNYRVSAKSNWWGQAGGPKAGQTLVTSGSLDTSSPLADPPDACN
jgi:hypothetical protein